MRRMREVYETIGTLVIFCFHLPHNRRRKGTFDEVSFISNGLYITAVPREARCSFRDNDRLQLLQVL